MKHMRDRMSFTDQQLDVLEKEFQEREYLDATTREKVSLTINLTQSKVMIWFKNRRAKKRKQNTDSSSPKLSHSNIYLPKVIKSEAIIADKDNSSSSVSVSGNNFRKVDKEEEGLISEIKKESEEEEYKLIVELPEEMDLTNTYDRITEKYTEQKKGLKKIIKLFDGPKNTVPVELQSLIISSNPECDIKFTTSQRMNTQMILSGFLLIKKAGPTTLSIGGRSISWKCVVAGCRFRCHTLEGELNSHIANHTHKPEPDVFSKKEARKKNIKKLVKMALAANSKMLPDVWIDTLKQETTPEILEEMMISLDALKQTVNRERRKIEKREIAVSEGNKTEVDESQVDDPDQANPDISDQDNVNLDISEIEKDEQEVADLVNVKVEMFETLRVNIEEFEPDSIDPSSHSNVDDIYDPISCV